MPKKIRLLIIEDNPTQMVQLVSMAGRFTSDITAALNAERGLLVFKGSLMMDQPYDVLLTDIMLPGMSGKDLIREVRSIEEEIKYPRRIKIIAVTADSPKQHVMDACRLGADSFLAKPVTPDSLREALESAGFAFPGA